MVSPEMLRRYELFAGLNIDEVTNLAMVAEEVQAEEGTWFFRQDEELHDMYLVVEGHVGIVVELPREEVVTSSVGPNEMFGWSGLVPPHETTAGAKATSPCRVIRFDCQRIRDGFESDWHFGYVMMERVAQTIRQRLRNLRTEALPCYAS